MKFFDKDRCLSPGVFQLRVFVNFTRHKLLDSKLQSLSSAAPVGLSVDVQIPIRVMMVISIFTYNTHYVVFVYERIREGKISDVLPWPIDTLLCAEDCH